MKPYQRLVVFVDWNSQIIAFGAEHSDPPVAARFVLKRVADRVARVLSSLFPAERFLIDLRLYHGWHKGFEPTANRKAIVQAVAEADFSALSPKEKIIFSGRTEFGDHLLAALPERLHVRPAIHLPNTLRKQDKRRDLVEKMVDTALAADLVASAIMDADAWLLVVTEDDDLVPPLFAAEALIRGAGGRALLLRNRTQAGPFLKLDGILCGEKP